MHITIEANGTPIVRYVVVRSMQGMEAEYQAHQHLKSELQRVSNLPGSFTVESGELLSEGVFPGHLRIQASSDSSSPDGQALISYVIAAIQEWGFVAAEVDFSIPPQMKEDPIVPYCLSCGMAMQRAGSCYVCGSCGSTTDAG